MLAAVQVAVGHRKLSRIGRPLAGHYAKAKVEPGALRVEFRLAEGEGADLAPGAGNSRLTSSARARRST